MILQQNASLVFSGSKLLWMDNVSLKWSFITFYQGLECCSCFRTFRAKSIVLFLIVIIFFLFLFEKRPASCTLDIRLSRFLNKKILWRTKVVGRGCSVKKVCFKKFLKVYRKRPVSETLFDKVADSQPGNLSKKKTPVEVSCKVSRNACGKQRLEGHRILLQTIVIAITNNISEANYQKGFVLYVFWDQLTSWVFLWELLTKIFLVLEFSLHFELAGKKAASFQVNCFLLDSRNMLIMISIISVET